MFPKRIIPGPGQESVWDYPRPPRMENSEAHIRVILNDITIAETRKALRVLETSHPPVYYIPPADVQLKYFQKTSRGGWCEWKGHWKLYSINIDHTLIEHAAWHIPDPIADFAAIKNYIAFYAGKMDACYVNDERVMPQPGDFYGGWITANIVGPFKGEPGTMGW